MAKVAKQQIAVAVQQAVPQGEVVWGEDAKLLMFTADNLRQWYANYADEGGKATATDQRRIAQLFRMVSQCDATTFNEQCEKLTEPFPKGSQDRKNWANVRSDVRAIYGALRFVPDVVPEGMGYGKTVAACRDGLKAAKLTWKGDALKDDVTKLAERRADDELDAARAGRIAYHKALNTQGEHFGDAEYAEEQEAKATKAYIDGQNRAESQKLVDGLFKKYGPLENGEFIRRVIEGLQDKLALVGEAEIQTADKQ